MVFGVVSPDPIKYIDSQIAENFYKLSTLLELMKFQKRSARFLNDRATYPHSNMKI